MDNHGHGTGMAGIALYENQLADLLANQSNFHIENQIESVKILPARGANDPKQYGSLTQEAVARAEQQNPERLRTICLAVTSDGRDQGFPSSWSAAIDQHSAGALDDIQRIYCVSAGNIHGIQSDPDYEYPRTNHEVASISDPAQSWNALTVGAYSGPSHIQSEEFDGWEPVAQSGGLCPSSTTSMMWKDQQWPLKPDIVMDGGNYAKSPDGNIDACDDLVLLTTSVKPTGALFQPAGDTSAAVAQAASYAARLQASYPTLWPETIRALMVHSAEWTTQMKSELIDNKKASVNRLLRCYGYGVPDIERARWSLNNRAAMVYQGELQPFRKDGSEVKSNEMHIHKLPWPTETLNDLGELQITLRITLSYFVEPNPGRRGWKKKHRYQSHGLRFAVKGPTEMESAFLRRLSRDADQSDKDQAESSGEPHNWFIGSNTRVRGSIHSDWCEMTAADLAACGQIAVYPVTGWWRERKHLERYGRLARYALVVTLASENSEIDLYTPIANEIAIPIEIQS
jgi:hypothetical protein